MARLPGILLALLLVAVAPAQEPDAVSPTESRWASVVLDDGTRIEGHVVHMSLECLELRVGDEAARIPTARIKSCQFETISPAAGASPAAAAEPAPAPASPGAQDPPELPDPAVAPRAPEAPQAPTAGAPASLPEPDLLAVEDEATPIDLRGRSRLRQRIEWLDERYPWLVPASPVQWISIGVMLFALLGLTVQTATRLASAESPEFARSLFLSLWYVVTVFLQVALVPVNHLTTVVLLLVNPALALFWLRALFGVTRGTALVSFAIQLGIALIGYGVLELVDAILASIRPVQA